MAITDKQKIVIAAVVIIIIVAVIYNSSHKNSVSPFQTKRTKARGVVQPKMEINPNFVEMRNMSPTPIQLSSGENKVLGDSRVSRWGVSPEEMKLNMVSGVGKEG